jgi:hypothetical protein
MPLGQHLMSETQFLPGGRTQEGPESTQHQLGKVMVVSAVIWQCLV